MRKLLLLMCFLVPVLAIGQVTFPDNSKQQGKKLFMDHTKNAKSVQFGLRGMRIDSLKLLSGDYVVYYGATKVDPAIADTLTLGTALLIDLSTDSVATKSYARSVGGGVAPDLSAYLAKADSTTGAGKYTSDHRADLIEAQLIDTIALGSIVIFKADSNKTNGLGFATPKYVLDHAGVGGGVTSVATGLGLSGGTITTTGTLLVDTANVSILSRQRAAHEYQAKGSYLSPADSTTGAGKYATDHRADLIEAQLIDTVALTDAAYPVSLIVPTVDGTSIGPYTTSFVSGYTSSAVGDGVYLDVNGKWQKWDKGTSLATYSGLLGIAMEVKATDQALKVALSGSFVYATAFPALTVGSPVYMDDVGALVVTQPSTADHVIRIVGWAVHADKIYFTPSPDYIMKL